MIQLTQLFYNGVSRIYLLVPPFRCGFRTDGQSGARSMQQKWPQLSENRKNLGMVMVIAVNPSIVIQRVWTWVRVVERGVVWMTTWGNRNPTEFFKKNKFKRKKNPTRSSVFAANCNILCKKKKEILHRLEKTWKFVKKTDLKILPITLNWMNDII